MANSFTPSYAGYGDLAGRYALDQQDYQKYKDAFGNDASLMYMIDRMDKRTAEQNDPKRLQERLDVLLPFYQKIGEQSQKFGMQSNLLGAGLSAIKSIPETINAFRAIPLQGLYQQTQATPNIFAAYGSGRPGFSGIRDRLGAA